MTNAAPKAIAIAKAIDAVMRHDKGRLLAGLIARLGDFQLAEDALQEAMISALGHWGHTGIPRSPTAWLMKVGLNKGIDRIRSNMRNAQKAQEFSHIFPTEGTFEDIEDIPDERLRLIFSCCHPALEEKSRVALTLRIVCNLTTREIAAVFLDSDATMAQRISRAKGKIKTKGITFRVPEPDQWDTRLGAVLSTIYLIFTTGYVTQETGPRDLCQEALFLAHLLRDLRPNDPEIEGVLALMQLTDARRHARIGVCGATVPIENQIHALWDTALVVQSQDLLALAMSRRHPGPYQIKAAIADCHMAEPAPDWPQMSLLYQSLWRHEPTSVVALNWAVVIGELGHTCAALEKIETLREELSDFQPWHAARAHTLAKLGRTADAINAYQEAIQRAPNDSNRIFLEARLREYETLNTGQKQEEPNA